MSSSKSTAPASQTALAAVAMIVAAPVGVGALGLIRRTAGNMVLAHVAGATAGAVVGAIGGGLLCALLRTRVEVHKKLGVPDDGTDWARWPRGWSSWE